MLAQFGHATPVLQQLHFVSWVPVPAPAGLGGAGGSSGEILLPSARHLEEGRGTTFFELLRRENCISRLCPRPLGSPPPPPNTQIG